MRQLNNKQFDTKEGASASLSEIVSSQLAPSVSQKDDKMQLIITSSVFDDLFENILRRFPYNWDCFETNDKAEDPFVVFKVQNKKDCKKLIKLCKSFVNDTNNFWMDRATIRGIIYIYELKTKGGK